VEQIQVETAYISPKVGQKVELWPLLIVALILVSNDIGGRESRWRVKLYYNWNKFQNDIGGRERYSQFYTSIYSHAVSNDIGGRESTSSISSLNNLQPFQTI